jgi:hypothetical protein
MKAFLLVIFVFFFSAFLEAQVKDSTTPVTGSVTQDAGMLGVYIVVPNAQVVLSERYAGGPLPLGTDAILPWPVPANPETTYTNAQGQYVLNTAVIGREYLITVDHASYHQQIRGLLVIDPAVVMRPGPVNVVNFALIQSSQPARYPVTVTALAGTDPLPDVVVTLMPVWEPIDLCVMCAAPIGIRFYPTDTTDRQGLAVFDSISLVPYVDYNVYGSHAVSGSQSAQGLFGITGGYVTLNFGGSGICLDHNPATEAGIKCYPNPFNPSITIQITGAASRAPVRIYDLRGARVAEFKNIGGAFTWNAQAMPSGVYLVKWTGPRGSQVQRIMLQK